MARGNDVIDSCDEGTVTNLIEYTTESDAAQRVGLTARGNIS